MREDLVGMKIKVRSVVKGGEYNNIVGEYGVVERNDNFSVTFTNVMYERCISALSSMPTRDKVDLSDYTDMLNSIRREVANWNIGII